MVLWNLTPVARDRAVEGKGCRTWTQRMRVLSLLNSENLDTVVTLKLDASFITSIHLVRLLVLA